MVQVLIEGFADETDLAASKRARYRPTITAIVARAATMIVDPGTVERQDNLRDAMRAHGIRVEDVTHVIHTHHHLDHTRNAGLFSNVPVIDGLATWSGVGFVTGAPDLPEGVRIIKTPGHTYDSITVLVQTDEGIVAICGDLWWWEGDRQSDAYAEDVAALQRARDEVLTLADFVVPGHGPKFRVRKSK